MMTRNEFRTLANKLVKDAIDDYVATTYETVPVIYDGENTQPPDPRTAWLRVHIRHSTVGPHTLAPVGARVFEQVGAVFVQVFTPHGRNAMTVNDALVAVLTNAFRNYTGVVRFKSIQAAEIGKSEGWQQTNFTADFAYDERG